MNLSRRYFLKSTGALAVYCGISHGSILNTLAADITPSPVRKNKTLVVIFLRGGTDGLNLIVPHGDPEYYKLRKGIAIPTPGSDKGAIDLDGFFGLHPAAQALLPHFQQGSALALHAVGYDRNTRSHFEEQDTWETGVTGNTIHSDGWLNRHLITSTSESPIRALSIGESLPRILRGKAPAYAIRGISDLTLPKSKAEAEITGALEYAYHPEMQAQKEDARELIVETGQITLEGVKLLKGIAAQPYKPLVEYPKTNIASRLQETARLIKANIGIEVCELDYGGWDTHNRQGGSEGSFANLLKNLSEALDAFMLDLGPDLDNTLVLTLSDFGRTAAENGTGGTDHGWANCMLAMGGAVKASSQEHQVLTQWPGLAKEQLYQKRDLLHTTDFRDVLGEIVSLHLGNPNLKKILPQHEFKNVGIIT